jgi:hypothetical protein
MLAEDRPNTSVTDNFQLNLSYVESEAGVENKFMNAGEVSDQGTQK